MNNAQDKACCCTTSQAAATIDQLSEPVRSSVVKYFAGVVALIAAWWLIYSHLEPFAGFFTRTLSRLGRVFNPRPSGQCRRLFCVRNPQGADAADPGGVRGRDRALFFHPRAHPGHFGRQARIGRQCPGGHAGHRHALLFLFGRTALSGFRHHGRAAGGDLFLSHFGPHGQRDCRGAALRAFRLEDCRDLYGHRAGHRHGRRLGDRAIENGASSRRVGISDSGRQNRQSTTARKTGSSASATGSRRCAISSARSGFMSCWALPWAPASTVTFPKG